MAHAVLALGAIVLDSLHTKASAGPAMAEPELRRNGDPPPAARGEPVHELEGDDGVLADLLVEDVSIDGMCGVY